MTNANKKFVAIDASVLGIKKPVMVLESNRNHLRATRMQITLGGLSDAKYDDDYEGMLQAYDETIEKEVKFLSDILSLTDKQIEAVYDLDQDDTVNLIMQVIGKIMHIDMGDDIEEEVEVEVKEEVKEELKED